jgi:TolB protein
VSAGKGGGHSGAWWVVVATFGLGALGVVIGAIVGFSSGQSCSQNDFFCFTPGQAAAFLAFYFGLFGAGIGLAGSVLWLLGRWAARRLSHRKISLLRPLPLLAGLAVIGLATGGAYALLGGTSSRSCVPAKKGGLIAFDQNAGTSGIFVMDTHGCRVRQLSSPEGLADTNPAWSPDGRKIAFHCDSGICLVNADGSNRRLLKQGQSYGDPAWSPNGKRIAFDTDGGIYVMNAAGSGVRRLTGGGSDASPSWSPDGREIAFGDGNSLYVVSATGGSVKNLHVQTSPGAAASSWSPDGATIAYECRGRNLVPLGAICLISPSGSYLRQLTSPTDADSLPSWSPNGKRIVFERTVEAPGDTVDNNIYVINADGSHLRQLTHGGDDEDPVWQPRQRRRPLDDTGNQ